MGAPENLALVKESQDAFESGDMQRLDRLIHDDVIWHEIGRAEPRRG